MTLDLLFRSGPVPVLATVGMVLIAASAGAAPITTFDFSDFPSADYGCAFKDFCTEDDILNLDLGDGIEVSNTRDGIRMSVSRPENFQLGLRSTNQILSAGNTGNGDYNPYVANFSRDLVFAGVDLLAPGVLEDYDLEELVFLEIWSGLGASGELLGRVEVRPDEALGRFVTLSVSAPEDTRIQSIRFGTGFDEVPGCESGCDLGFGNTTGTADNIRVRPIPEPSSATLFAIGALLVGRATSGSRPRGDTE